MKRIEIAKLYKNSADFSNAEVTVCGWVKTIRDSKSLGFMQLNDGSFFKDIQVVFEENHIENFKEVAKLNVGSAVRIKGIVVLTPEAKQPLEIQAREVFIEGKSTSDYPLQKKSTHSNTLELLLTFVLAQILSAPLTEFVLRPLMLFTNFFKSKALFMHTLQ